MKRNKRGESRDDRKAKYVYTHRDRKIFYNIDYHRKTSVAEMSLALIAL